MSVPTFLSTSYDQVYYEKLTAVTDVATFLTSIATALETGPMAWTDDAGSPKTFKTPVDAAGRFFDVKFTKISATNLEMRLRDASGATVCTRRIQIDGGGTDIEIFAGDKHLIVQANRATPEVLRAFMLECSPDDDASVAVYVTGNGYRDNADSADGSGTYAAQLFMYDTGVGGMAVAERAVGSYSVGVGAAIEANTVTGRYIFRDFYAFEETVGGTTYELSGRLPQMLLGPDFGSGTLKNVPIDDATTAEFQQIALAPVSGSKFALWARKTA